MTAIEIISASAGSGKTYRLAEVLEKAVKDGSARPHAVIATTFTRKAAAELRERVRRRLYEAKMPREAEQLNAALMGTVNSVCGRLVSDFAFELGLPPDLRVLDENFAARALQRALSGIVDNESNQNIARLQMSFYEWKIESLIARTVELARANGMDSTNLAKSRDNCVSELKVILGGPPKNKARLENDLAGAIGSFITHFQGGDDQTQKTQGCVEKVQQFLAVLRSGRTPKWQDWSALARMDIGKKSVEAAQPVIRLAADHIFHPDFQEDLESAVRIVFDLAARALDSYAEYKRERGLVDFVDQECLALEVLSKPEVTEHLKGEIDLVLVDEFQDTSPIQLAIFLKLAELAKRSVWVGDQKQSIFGFRGSDPELMNAAIETILGGSEPETLPKSWRSRPDLVRLTSSLFGQAFPRHGIPRNRVLLEPSMKDEPEGEVLGPFIERWIPKPAGRSSDDRAAALAGGVRGCLADRGVTVRDRITGQTRAVRPSDIAILCRQNNTCIKVAENLARLGIRSALSRTGLMNTPEVRLMISGLRLWSDPNDALSAAEIALLLEYPGEPDRWMVTLVEKPGLVAFKDIAIISRLRDASTTEGSLLGVMATFDRVTELLDVRDICRRWGNAGHRLANVEVLRNLAIRYITLSSDEGTGMTTAGFGAFLADLEDGVNDLQAYDPDADALIVSTWHKAKGLEWPIVILNELEADYSRFLFDVRIASERKKILLSDPLGGRWIRYWPNPFHPATKTSFHDRLTDHPVIAEVDAIERRERLRLLYVGWTRARDRVVLHCAQGKMGAGMLEELRDEKQPLLDEPENGRAMWGGNEVRVLIREAVAAERVPVQPESEATYCPEGPKEYPLAWDSPKQLKRSWEPAEPEVLGTPIALRSQVDMQNVGNAVHGFLAADSKNLESGERREMAAGLLRRWNLSDALKPENLLEMGDRLRKWADSKWPGARWHREWPIFHRIESGSVARGFADLVLETPNAIIVIDHKAYPSPLGEARAFALSVALQLEIYAEAVQAATGKDQGEIYVHLPLAGLMVQLRNAR